MRKPRQIAFYGKGGIGKSTIASNLAAAWAEAAIIVDDPDPSFGCMACAVANDYIEYMIRSKGIPTLIVPYPYDEEAAKVMVKNVFSFLRSLGSES